MSVLSWLGLKKSDEQKQSEAADSAKASQSLKSAIALANYRQNSRNQYHNLLTAETTPYQAYSDRLAAMYGTGMSTAGLSANENPVSLRDTGVGAHQGSNYAGGDTTDADGYVTHHAGIQDYLNGTVQNVPVGGGGVKGDLTDPATGRLYTRYGDGSGIEANPDGTTTTFGSNGQASQTLGKDALASAGLDQNGNPIAGQGPVSSAPRLTSPGPQGPGAGLNFAPRRP